MTRASALLVIAALAAAGCMQGEPDEDPHQGAEDAVHRAASRVLALEHDAEAGHQLGQLHQGSHNLELVGYSNGVDDSGDPDRIPARGRFNEIALRGSLAFLSRTSSDGSFGGFSVVDVADPAHPKVVGQYRAQGGSDIEVSDDGRLVFLSTQRNSPDQVVGALRDTQDPKASLPRGLYIVRLDDPREPVLDSFVLLPSNGPHTITYTRHPNGNEYLVACTYDLITDPVTGALRESVPATQRLLVYLITRGGPPVPGLPTVQLTPVAQFQKLPGPGSGLVFPHDASVDVHASGRVLITVSYWDLGVRIVDFTEPPAPSVGDSLPMLAEVGAVTDFSPSAYNNLHFAKPFPMPLNSRGGAIDVTVAEPEIITAENETGQITFLDTTDPSAPRRISWWSLPEQDPRLGVRDLDFSPHNFDLWDGKVALTHYHAGVWVLDVSTPANLEDPKAVAFYMTAKPRTDSPSLQPNAWSLRVQDGLLYVSDEATGLYVLRYTGP